MRIIGWFGKKFFIRPDLNYIEPFITLFYFFFDGLLAGRAVFHLGILNADPRVDRNRTGNKRITADDGISSYNSVSAKDRCTCIYYDVVLDRRMTFFAGKLLASARRKRTYRNALIDLYIVTDHRSLTYYYSRAVIDKEIPSDRCAGMDIDSRS